MNSAVCVLVVNKNNLENLEVSEIKKKNLFITNRVDSSSFLQTKLSKKNSDYKIMQKREISIKTLDSLFSTIDLSKPSLIKIDVQGYEPKVFQGMQKTIRSSSWFVWC